MSNTYRNILMTSVATLAVSWSFLAIADDSDTFDVTAEVIGVCEITAGNTLAFGDYNPVTGDAVDGSTTISVTCSDGMDNPDVGLAYTGDMQVGEAGYALNYGLFQDTGRETDWGDSEGVSRQSVTADGTATEMTVYGRIEADQTDAPIGDYTETVTATVYF